MKTNRLAAEKSPYLAQHAHNPVDWYPWGEEAFEKAQRENKPIFLSIGYSTCYWCHVMEKECFELEDVAAALGAFVSVKVDREEHPEVDEIYMEAVMAMTGRGGWPMSVFLTPDLKPFWGGTYIPHAHFLQLLDRIQNIWQSSPEQIKMGGEKLLAALAQEPRTESAVVPDEEIWQRFFSQAKDRFDPHYGGFGAAPKFPPSMVLRVLLRLSKEKMTTLPLVEKTLVAMACGGIYDQVGGGFHRYSTDERWLVPHFEKMLYDNALLATVYLEAKQCTGKDFYGKVAQETLDYLLRDMRHEGGAFYSAEDAGEVRKEGEFYLWHWPELQGMPNFPTFQEIFSLSPAGNFEGANILACDGEEAWLKSRDFKEAWEYLRNARNQRPRPHRDEKILTAWNGLALGALALGSTVLEDPRYLSAAEQCAHWLKKNLWNGKTLWRRYAGGEVKYQGTASDYTFLIDGLLKLYHASFQEEWLYWARDLQAVLDQEFWEEDGYFTASRKESFLVVRKKDRFDGALPSPNSVAYSNLLALAQYFQDPQLRERAEALQGLFQPWLKTPYGLPQACLGIYYRYRGEKLAVIAGPGALQEAKQRTKDFLPDLWLACAEEGSRLPVAQGKASKIPQVFLCERGLCHAPLPWA